MRKKIFLLIIFVTISCASTIAIPNKFYFINSDQARDVYEKYLAYKETDTLYFALKRVLNNKKLKNRLYFYEMGKVKIPMSELIQQFVYFLGGWPKYTDTYFDNNSNLAGMREILKNCYEDDSNELNIPNQVVNQIKQSADSLEIFEKIKEMGETDDPQVLLKLLREIINNYYDVLRNSKCSLLTEYNSNIKDMMQKDYRLYVKGTLLKTIAVFKMYFNKNY